jgi:lysophospholipase L1-like esterase
VVKVFHSGIPLAIPPSMKLTLLAAALLFAACSEEVGVPAQQAEMPAGKVNVVTLGDSLAYGAGDESGRGIAGRLEVELERRGINEADVVNLGINGAQTADLIARLKQARVRSQIGRADAIVLSIGANDLFRSQGAREETLRAPLQVADRILTRLEEIVATIHTINPDAEILILGGYNPVPSHAFATLINDYLRLWDSTLEERFAKNPRVSVVRMADIVSPQRLSRHDNFHPGGDAYEEASKRIAAIITRRLT